MYNRRRLRESIAAMSTGEVTRPKPFLVSVKAGRTYHWCACGRSSKQPFCDGSHKGTEFSPVAYLAVADDELLFCGCKQTRDRPFCDGAHTNLAEGSPLDDPDSFVMQFVGDSADVVEEQQGLLVEVRESPLDF